MSVASVFNAGKLSQLWREEVRAPASPRLWLAGLLAAVIPIGAGGRLRAALYRAAGIPIGRGTIVAGPVIFGAAQDAGRPRLSVGAGCYLNAHVFIDATAAPVTLGDGVSLGHHVVIVTTGHEIGPPEFRAGAVRPAPVNIGDGAWVAARAVLLPGVTVGAGAVVAAGAVVTRDVPPNTLVGGAPARPIRTLPA